MAWQPVPYTNGENLNGVWWHKAPLPPRLHRCTPQSRAVISDRKVERCACGATRLDDGAWFERNSRKRP